MTAKEKWKWTKKITKWISATLKQGEQTEKLKASDLVRLALFTEHKRIPLRRDEINKKVLGSNTRSFTVVFERAQRLLRKTFAMELVELQSRNYREQDPATGDDLQNATGVKKKAAAAGSKTYILRSVLNIAIIEQAALTGDRLLEEQITEGPDDDDDEDTPRNYGSIISWSSADQLAALGLLHVILALILVNGRSISELELRANLKRLRIPSSGTVPTNAQSTHRAMPIDTYLSQLMRQGYIDRVRLGDNKAAGGKRGRGPAATQVNADDNQAYEWRWGTRAHSEIGEQAVASFVAEFMTDCTRQNEDEEDEEDDGGPVRGRGRGKGRQDGAAKKLETMLKAIERASGGNLAGIK
ncbi:MAGE-domain-containing protein [Gyrodon lividus]|nr:MAGE-domain-containing protein [Gyrodon lividus]